MAILEEVDESFIVMCLNATADYHMIMIHRHPLFLFAMVSVWLGLGRRHRHRHRKEIASMCLHATDRMAMTHHKSYSS